MFIERVILLVTSIICFSLADHHHRDSFVNPRFTRLVPGEDTKDFWYNQAFASILSKEARNAGGNRKAARNVVMFLGDGMSVPTLAAARTLLGQRQGNNGEETELSFEKFPTSGLVKTYCVNQQVPDSACTATAYLCGVKNNFGAIGVTAAVPSYNCPASIDTTTHVESIAEWAIADGKDAGIVTTTRITHASPAGAYAKTGDRYYENDAEVENAGYNTDDCPDIAHQLIHKSPGNQFKVILGGGRREMIPTTMIDEEHTPGRRTDGRNLIDEWQADKQAANVSYAYTWNRDQLMAAAEDMPDYLLGLFEGNHCRYNMETDATTEPTLAEMTEVAIKSLSRNKKGFFLFIESGLIDIAHHENYLELALDETIELSKAVEKAQEMLSDDTLIVVTADHAHVMSYNGYNSRGANILGPTSQIGEDGIGYMTLSYTNGPGARVHTNGIRPDVTTDADFGDLRWRAPAKVPLELETHGGDDVAVFAIGPQHGMFAGVYEQSQIPHIMAYAACIGPGPYVCNSATTQHLTLLMLISALLITLFNRTYLS